MADESDESPFAAFARPKPSAIEEWRRRQDHDTASRRAMARGYVCVLAGATLGSVAGVVPATDLERLPYPLAGGTAYGLLGSFVGALIGCACFSIMRMSGDSEEPSFESEIARRDPMTVIRVMVVAWVLIGAVFGSVYGAGAGVSWGGAPLPDSQFPWVIVGSMSGALVGGVEWRVWERRVARRKVGAEPGAAPDPPI